MAVILGLLACGQSAPNHFDRRNTAVLAWENFPLSFDPLQGQDQASQRLLSLTHQGLLKRGPNLELLPDGCLSWRWTQPYTELVFEFPIRGAAMQHWPAFADGHTLSAEDALRSVQALRDPHLLSPKASPFQDEIATLSLKQNQDSTFLCISLNRADPGFAANVCRGVLGITENGTGGPGTGPYAIKDLVPEQRIRLMAKPNHPDFAHHNGHPLDLELRWIPDATSRLLALRHGSVDACPNNLPPDLMLKPKGFEVSRRPGANLEYVAFNCAHPVLKDARVRRALSLALDRPALVQGLMGGMAREAWGFFPPELPFGFDGRVESGAPIHAAERQHLAASLMDQAGYRRDKNGHRFTLRMHATPEIYSRMKALAVQAQWGRIGVQVQIVTREFGSLLSDVMAGRFDVASLRWVGIADPQMLFNTFHSSKIPPNGFNRGHFIDAETDRLLEEAQRTSIDADRFALLRRAQGRILDQSPYAFLWWPDQVVAHAPGLELDLNAVGDFSGVWRNDADPHSKR